MNIITPQEYLKDLEIKKKTGQYGGYSEIRSKSTGFKFDSIQWLRDIQTTEEYKFKNFEPGHLYYYEYVPKWKDELDYYDGRPLGIFLKPHEDGKTFYTYNIHFIPMKLREKLFNQFKFNNKGDVINASIWVGLDVIKRLYPVIIRRYLYTHIRAKIYPIPMKVYDVENVKLFPTEKFYKKTSDEIFKIALMKYRSSIK